MPSALAVEISANEEVRMPRFNVMLALTDALEHLLPPLEISKEDQLTIGSVLIELSRIERNVSSVENWNAMDARYCEALSRYAQIRNGAYQLPGLRETETAHWGEHQMARQELVQDTVRNQRRLVAC